MSGFVRLNTSDVPRGSGLITQVVWGRLVRVVFIDPQGRDQATKDHTRIGHSVARLSAA